MKKIELKGLEKHRAQTEEALTRGVPLLIGESATGKTTLAGQILSESHGKVTRINFAGDTSTDQIVGRPGLKTEPHGFPSTVFNYGEFVELMKSGGAVILDEVNYALPDVLAVLKRPIEERSLYCLDTREEIVAHKNFRMIATCNPAHGYAGTKEFNAAFNSRFSGHIKFARLQGADLLRAIDAHFPGADAADAADAANFFEAVNRLKDQDEIETLVTFRQVLNALGSIANGLKKEWAFEICFYNLFKAHEIDTLKSNGLLSGLSEPKGKTVNELFGEALNAEALAREVETLKKKLDGYSALAAALEAVKGV